MYYLSEKFIMMAKKGKWSANNGRGRATVFGDYRLIFFICFVLVESFPYFPPTKLVCSCILSSLNVSSISYIYLQEYNWMLCLFSLRDIFIWQNLILQMHFINIISECNIKNKQRNGSVHLYVHITFLAVTFHVGTPSLWTYIYTSICTRLFIYITSTLQVCF